MGGSIRNGNEEPRVQSAHSRVSARVLDSKSPLIHPSPIRITPYPRQLSDLRPLYEINERCLELLVRAARTDRPTFPLVGYLRELLCSVTPETRARAAHRPLLLIDIQLTNGELWRTASDRPVHPTPRSGWQGAFPRPAAVQLARWTLSFAWHKVRTAPHELCLLGITTDVANAIAQLPITEIAPVAERYFRFVRPRWEDRPAVWRRLLFSAQSADIRRARDVNLYGIQLLTAELMSPVARSRSAS
jgi:hypothetical protein